MATRCDKTCESCTRDRAGRYLCLKSEEDFLSSILKVGASKQGKETYLLGLEPSELIDWYLYAKRTHRSYPTGDPIGWAFKLLDEIGKLVFGLTQVTWRKAGTQYFNLLMPLESNLLTMFLGNVSPEQTGVLAEGAQSVSYFEAAHNALQQCGTIEKDLANATTEKKREIASSYQQSLECRIAYTQLQSTAGFAITIDNIDYHVWTLSHGPNRKDQAPSVKLAAAFLHGLLRFGLLPHLSASQERLGYWLDKTESEVFEQQSETTQNAKAETEKGELHFCGVPDASISEIKLAAELSASFAEEFLRSAEATTFDVLFMCLEEDGWFWAFNTSQLTALKKSLRNSVGPAIGALRDFRFRIAGVINHLEHTECLVNAVDDFAEEQFICTAAGYKLETRSDLAKDFAIFEEAIPGVKDSSFYYFRLSSHEPDPKGGKRLKPGALVAVFPVKHNLDPRERSSKLARIRGFVERWRAKIDAIPAVRSVVREIARPHQEKTARAAIMSRNLSHNVGSHALANSRFFEAIGILDKQETAPSDDENYEVLKFPHPDPKRDDRGKILRDKGEVQFKTMEENGKDTGKILLADSPVQKGEAWRARGRLSGTNSYLQGRMDFIARALGETTNQPEPMFFVGDLLQGFRSQSVLLNTLLSDNGYTAPDLDISVKIVRVDGTTSNIMLKGKAPDHQIRHADFDEIGSVDDVLVAIPGGMVGRHAFYAFLENVLRNAAKYGNASKSKLGDSGFSRLQLDLRLRELKADEGAFFTGDPDRKSHACYVLSVSDNLSKDPDETVSARIRRHLNEPLIDEEGKARTEGHGIQEMKVCASFLAGGDQTALVFPEDEETDRVTRILGKGYQEHAQASQQKIKRLNSLAAHPEEFDSASGDKVLTFSLLIQQPVLLGIVPPQTDGMQRDLKPAKNEPTVTFYRSVQVLAEHPAYFGLVCAKKEDISISLEHISKLHTVLPFRLMLAINDDDAHARETQVAVDKWQSEQAAKWSKNKDENHPFPLPVRRVRVISCPALFDPNLTEESASDLRALILEIYDKWIEAFKGDELRKRDKTSAPKWNLAIGFQRSKDSVLRSWSPEGGANGLHFQSKCISLHLFFKMDESTGCKVNHVKDDGKLGYLDVANNEAMRKTLLALDNHGNVIADEKRKEFGATDACPVYHAFSGSQQMDLFHLLESPPSQPFARGFLLFSVVEALLTRVVVVDERVADAAVERTGASPIAFGPKLRCLQRAGIFPIYSITTSAQHWLPGTAEQAVKYAVVERAEREGLHLPGKTVPMIRTFDGTKNELDLAAELHAPDLIVIHEGVTDQMHDKEGWKLGDHQALYAICPAVVRTSGRGHASRHLGNVLPFYEFSELSDYTYRQMNKVGLVRGLLSLRGSQS